MKLTTSTLELWNRHIADAISNVSNQTFPQKLETALRALVAFDICMVFSYSTDEGSTVLYHNMEPNMAGIVVDDYLAGPYLLDPFYSAASTGKKIGFGTMNSLAPDHFTRSEFYRHHYVRTGISDEMGLFFPVSNSQIAVLSVTRQKPKRRFTDFDRKSFAAAAPIIKQYATSHWNNTGKITDTRKSNRSIEGVFENFGLGVLTAREREIIALILKGHSSVSIGHVLGISAGTVKIHRKNAYSNLQISSQAELFSLFLSALEKSLTS